ncbi:unnamed protein product [Coccothraustes coccothraustes]
MAPGGSRRAARTAFRRCAAAAESPSRIIPPTVPQSRPGWDCANCRGWPAAGHTHCTQAGSERRGGGAGEPRHRCPRGGRAVGPRDGQGGAGEGSIGFWKRLDLPELWGKWDGEKREMRSALRNPGVNPLLSKGRDVITPQVNAGEAMDGIYRSRQLCFPPHFSEEKPNYYSPFGLAGEQGYKSHSKEGAEELQVIGKAVTA